MATQRIKAGDIELAFEFDGPADAPVIMLAHCFTADHHFWDFNVDALSAWRILRYDARGHGASDRPDGPWSLDMMTADAINLLDALDLEAVNFCGVSMGGMTGQTLAINHPDRIRTLCVANSPCRYTAPQQQLWRERSETVLTHGTRQVHDALMKRWFTDDAATTHPATWNYIAGCLSAFSPASFAAVTPALCELDTTDSLAQITAPTLLFGSPDDPSVPVAVSELMAAKISNSTLHWLSPSRHLATLQNIDEFNQLYLEFLDANAAVSR